MTANLTISSLNRTTYASNSLKKIFSHNQSYERICESVSRVTKSQDPDTVISIKSVIMNGSLKNDYLDSKSNVDVSIKQVYWKRKGAIILQVFENNKLYDDF